MLISTVLSATCAEDLNEKVGLFLKDKEVTSLSVTEVEDKRHEYKSSAFSVIAVIKEAKC